MLAKSVTDRKSKLNIRARQHGVHPREYFACVCKAHFTFHDHAPDFILALLNALYSSNALAHDLFCVLAENWRPEWLHHVLPELRKINGIHSPQFRLPASTHFGLFISRGGKIWAMLDRETVEQHLLLAEMHVSDGERHIARQREIVAELKDDGKDLETARNLLAIFEELYATHVADRDRIRRELAALRSWRDSRVRLRTSR